MNTLTSQYSFCTADEKILTNSNTLATEVEEATRLGAEKARDLYCCYLSSP
jgi:hypothetical protein